MSPHSLLFLTNIKADLCSKPDGTFVSREAFAAERVRLIEGSLEGFVEIEGTPDMVLEVVGGSSVSKDTEWLRDLYWKAGIAEYWLVDCRGKRVDFDILRHTAGGYSATSKSAGWMESAVFGHAFLLTRQADEMGQPEYTLEARANPRAEAFSPGERRRGEPTAPTPKERGANSPGPHCRSPPRRGEKRAKTLTPTSTTQVPRPQGVGNEIKIAIVPDAKLARTMCRGLSGPLECGHVPEAIARQAVAAAATATGGGRPRDRARPPLDTNL